MNNSARDIILERLQNASPIVPFEESDFSVLEEKQLSQSDKIARYKAVTQAVNTEVHECERDDWISKVSSVLESKGITELMYGPKSDLGRKLVADWDNARITLKKYQTTMEENKDDLFSVPAAITSSLGAIAETGSLILWPTKEEPRLLSLTPPVHVAIVSADQFYTTFYEAIEVNRWCDNMPTNALLISGPSKTADIEQELCYGVHGPKELIVFIVH